ncbi:MAG: hypothetical protein P8Z35_18665 [Ignavibacteriaceae bacterium]
MLINKNWRRRLGGWDVIFNTRGTWSTNKYMFNGKGKRYYLTSNSFGILWVGYIIIIVVFNSF